MATVLVTAAAVEDVDRLIETHRLPPTARARIRARLRQLEPFPYSGAALGGRWTPARRLDGPWPWMLFVYDVDDDADTVTILTAQDARTSFAAQLRDSAHDR